MNKDHVVDQLSKLGIDYDDALALRRISMTLRRWFERECGDGNGWIERDEETGKPYYYYDGRYLDPKPRRYAIPDREKGAMKRLKGIMDRYPELGAYVQGDPRGASLYVYPKGESRLKDYNIESIYSSIGTAVFK